MAPCAHKPGIFTTLGNTISPSQQDDQNVQSLDSLCMENTGRAFLYNVFLCLPLVVVVGLTIDAEQRSLLPTESVCDSMLRHFVVNA